MQHRMHYLCMIPAAVLLGWVLLGGGSTALAGVGLLVLICPLTMGIVMWLLMRQPDHMPRVDHHDGARRDEIGGRP